MVIVKRFSTAHPRSISKYVFIRMQAAGKNGTKGQAKPEIQTIV
jgi:hypothetical protein